MYLEPEVADGGPGEWNPKKSGDISARNGFLLNAFNFPLATNHNHFPRTPNSSKVYTNGQQVRTNLPHVLIGYEGNVKTNRFSDGIFIVDTSRVY